MPIILKNTTFIDWKSLEFNRCHIKIYESPNNTIEFIPITETTPGSPGKNDCDTVIDCKNKLVTKSFACGHHHIYSALARGMGAPKKSPENFYDILKYIWWTLDKQLDLEMIEASALVTALQCAKNGVTFVIDHHASPFAVENSLETIANAFEKVGVSNLLCYEMSDRDGDIPKQNGLDETERFLKNGGQGLVGLHASFTVGADLLDKAVTLAEKFDSGIHVHVAEDLIDRELCLKVYGKSVIERFHDAGVLDFKKTLLAHCLHIDDNERAILKNSPAFIAQNTDSNLNNNVGFFDPKGLNIDNIMLGTDGMHSDMLRSAKSAYLVGQTTGSVSPKDIYKRFRRVHDYIHENKFHGDDDNNLAILNYDSPTEINQDNFYGHFIYGIDSNHVESVISNGRLIVHNKKIMTVDEPGILRFSKEMALKLWKKMNG